MLSSYMASTAQIEAFAWWLGQSEDGRSIQSIAQKFGCSVSTAEKWRAKFAKMLANSLQSQVGLKLREYVAEYEHVQRVASQSAASVANLLQTRANELTLLAETGGCVDVDEVAKLASALKTVYSLAEAASGADVAKRRASQKPTSGAKGDGKLALPDLGAFFLADSVELEDESPLIASSENPPINESGNESGSASAAMPEK